MRQRRFRIPWITMVAIWTWFAMMALLVSNRAWGDLWYAAAILALIVYSVWQWNRPPKRRG